MQASGCVLVYKCPKAKAGSGRPADSRGEDADSAFFFLIYFIIYLFSAVLGLHCCTGFSLWRAGLLSSHSAQASHCSGCCCRARAPGRAGFNGCGACAQQWLPGSRAQARQLCFMGLVAPCHVRFPLNQGWNSCLLPWQAESYPLSHQGSPNSAF